MSLAVSFSNWGWRLPPKAAMPAPFTFFSFLSIHARCSSSTSAFVSVSNSSLNLLHKELSSSSQSWYHCAVSWFISCCPMLPQSAFSYSRDLSSTFAISSWILSALLFSVSSISFVCWFSVAWVSSSTWDEWFSVLGLLFSSFTLLPQPIHNAVTNINTITIPLFFMCFIVVTPFSDFWIYPATLYSIYKR